MTQKVISMYQEEDKAQVRRRQAETAIQLAMANRWEEAVTVNRSILSLFPNDVDSHNRLGKALMELSHYPEAKKAYKKALELDATNQIAKKNLERLNTLAKSGAGQAQTTQIDPSLFIEEMGKTTITTLEQIASEILAKLNAGDRVELRHHDNTLAVETPGGEFIGTVEPKLRMRVIRLMEEGNKYAAAITSVGGGGCRIIVKETYRDPSRADRPSFPTVTTAEGMRPYTKESLLRHGTQAEDTRRAEATVEEELDGEDQSKGSWADESVIQEGHIRLSDAAAAEEAAEEELEE